MAGSLGRVDGVVARSGAGSGVGGVRLLIYMPHFHTDYGEYGITVTILDGVVEGQFPRRALRHVLEWYELHREELQENWERARRREPVVRIDPLE